MNPAIVVLNAGSSSLKFSVYEVVNDNLKLVVKGQVEGIGTSPKFRAKDPTGNTLAQTASPSTKGKFGQA